ncbi:LytS/YhcK type 5TM receptor domain-containing protein [Desulfogranum japonicum]|uniref:LytS/YhcK type 5TM receptor domain-containing protein n=1 Tax=Desulfogranum japonicum TaxID=231447 RepID=UPI00048CD867|nr:LytS/YhcK type 5TM receptor domain-containing protein [Desulfogranum japonicum]
MTITALITLLLKHVGLLIAGAFVVLTLSPVQELNFRRDSAYNRVFLIIFFGFIGILGTYSGNAIFNSIANLRAMAVITAGLFGGPVVGFGAGFIAGAHRFLIDPWGFSTLACSLATVLEGILAGLVHAYLKDRSMDWRIAFILTFAAEIMHMGLVLLFSRPIDDARELVHVIAWPMIIGNSLGATLFVHVLNTLKGYRERRDSDQTQKIFDIANTTVGYLRAGLNVESAKAMAQVIYDKLPVVAVSVTDATHVLAHVGEGNDHHLPENPISTRATGRVIDSGSAIFLKQKELIGCQHEDCPFHSAIIVPLKKSGKIVGTVKFYGSATVALNTILFEVARGLADLFSIQLELEDIQIKDKLLAHAEIRHLQAQINPHFLFNSLNTIASFCRTAPDKARELILDLSFYMRQNLDSSRGFISLADELEQIHAYLAIEKARFGELIKVDIQVEPGCEQWPIPSLIIQPLIENAIKHGLKVRESGGTVGMNIQNLHNELHVTVQDNGAGISEKVLETLLDRREMDSSTCGIGLRNSHFRLEHIYGPQYGIHIESFPNKGTTISFCIPHRQDLLTAT